MTILVTNDDSHTTGLEMLLSAAKSLGDAYAIVPNKQRSAISKALTLHKALRFHRLGNGKYELSGTPADIVLFALKSGEVPKPDMVLSGINFGDNTTTSSILASGTIGACWEATLEGVPAIAFSKFRKRWETKRMKEHAGSEWGNENDVQRIVEIIRMLRKKHVKDCFFSVNLPAEINDNTKITWPDKIQRMRFRAVIEKRADPGGTPYYWLSGDFTKREKGTDLYEVAENNNITISTINLDLVKNINAD